jgi:hypothetical protein
LRVEGLRVSEDDSWLLPADLLPAACCLLAADCWPLTAGRWLLPPAACRPLVAAACCLLTAGR